MISVVCVYNEERTLKNVLLKSLANQTAEFELVTLDNTSNRFKSAAEAMNYGGARAKDDYIMFAHQDVWLGSSSWLEEVEEMLESIADLGIAGVYGVGERGSNFSERLRFSVKEPEEVQTLDECLLIVPRSVFSKLQFDAKTFNGWHCYGADYCLCVKQLGLKAYVLPALSYHRPLRIKIYNLLTYQKRLYNKHKKNYKKIYATSGEISWLTLRLRFIFIVLSPLYGRLFPHRRSFRGQREHLNKELASCSRVLDLGCGNNSILQYCNVPLSVGVELFNPYLQESKRKGIHSQYIMADVRKLEFKPKSFDAVIAFELLDHLTKQEGYALINKATEWTKKKVIITTLNGYAWQVTFDNNPLQEYKSSWDVKELRDLGFKVRGFNRWKRLTGYRGELKYRPAFLWSRVSDLTDEIIYYFPRLSFLLIATKRIHEAD